MPKVSIIMPTYNRTSFIYDALQSVLTQTYTDWELIIIDDASTDNTYDLLKGYISSKVLYIKNEKNLGISRSRNIAISKASGEYIAMLDSDDIWIDEEKLKKQVTFLEKNQDCGIIGTQVRTIDQNGLSIGKMTCAESDRAIRQSILRKNQFVQSSILFVKKATGTNGENGPYDSALVVDEDYELWLRIGTTYTFANLPDVTTGYRIHPGSIIRKKKILAAKTHLEIIVKYRKKYPGFLGAYIKGCARILYAYVS